MHRLAMYVLGAGLLISQGSVGASLVPERSNATVSTSQNESGSSARHPSRTLSLAEQGHTDRIIIIWKGETVKRAAAAAQASALTANGKAAAQAGAAAYPSVAWFRFSGRCRSGPFGA